MPTSTKESYFSISTDLVPTHVPLSYSLFINVAGEEAREHYIRIFPVGGVLLPGEVEEFKRKYSQIYVSEGQRAAYMDAVVKGAGRTAVEKTAVLKDSAIHYLGSLFDGKREITTEALNQSISGCRDVVVNMVDTIQGYDIDQLQEMIANLSFHDFYTYDHSINVSMYCVVIYRAMFPNATHVEIVQAGLGGMLHDLGKIKISTQIINNPGKLSKEELQEIQKHPDYGRDFLNIPGIKLPDGVDLALVNRVVHEHHENYDGTGYPGKLASDKIHLLARITAVADFFDAITTKRSYHEALSVDDALALMQKFEGKKLDPKIFQLFAAHTREHNASHVAGRELATDFDPCQPHQKLPFQKSDDLPPAKLVSNVPKKDEIQKLLLGRTRALVDLDQVTELDPVKARGMVESALELSFSLYSQNALAPLVQELLKEAASIALKWVGAKPKLLPLLASVRLDQSNYTAAHSVFLAELCCAIASEISWESELTFSKLITASFLHDIALGNHRIAQFQGMDEIKKDPLLTPEEIERFRLHPQRASEYARELAGVPGELEIILAQHHETGDGTGFPNGLFYPQLNPLTCLFILAHELLSYYLGHGKSAQFQNWLEISLEKYPSGHFRKILNNLKVIE